MAQVTTQDMLDTLHLDSTEYGAIYNLIFFAQDYIQTTTDKNATIDQIIAKTNEKVFNQAVKAIVESLYFGNAETQGFGIRSQVLLNSIRNMYQGA
ncbi:phage gp6-like head-tail connector protein [Leuconostoc citreum]|uniref:phage gp6-like head-tail connector protein n=1 Tax=Leuconostoc citreum TaxID=33964 RepID=UPI001C200065|nr:phage gp6-like head-tail connector protein [Leuconostoc citreum]MBU7451607.1 phage gp6-like head-tail connector protein [Leuconostoc citreum]